MHLRPLHNVYHLAWYTGQLIMDVLWIAVRNIHVPRPSLPSSFWLLAVCGMRYALRNASNQNTLVRVVNLEDCGHAVGNKAYSGIWDWPIASFLGLPHFSSSVCIQYNTRSRRERKKLFHFHVLYWTQTELKTGEACMETRLRLTNV